MGRHFSGGWGMCYVMAVLAWAMVLIATAQASPCYAIDPSGNPYLCGQGFFQISPSVIHVDDPVVLTASLYGVEPITNFFFFFDGSFASTNTTMTNLGSSETDYTFDGVFTVAGESDILGFATDGYGNGVCVGGNNGPGCTPLVVDVLDRPAAAPEPSTWVMLLIGFAAIGFAGYRNARLNLVDASHV
jgi:hypothetical protein